MFSHQGYQSLAALALCLGQPTLTSALSIGHVLRPRDHVFAPTVGIQGRAAPDYPCTPIIDLNPKKHNCKAAELVVNGTCQPIGFGDSLDSCEEDCGPGQWCFNGKCESIQVILNPLHCPSADGPVQLGPGEVCLNGVVVPLNITGNATSCGEGEQAQPCEPGNYCQAGECTPITIGSDRYMMTTDPYHCGDDKEECAASAICLSGACYNVTLEDAMETCNPNATYPGSFCRKEEVLPIYMDTYAKACNECAEEEMLVAGSCMKDIPETCPLPPGAAAAGSSGPAPSVSRVQIQGQDYEFGNPASCGGQTCGGNSICCSGNCLRLQNPAFEGCSGSCGTGDCCFNNQCQPLFPGSRRGGPGGGFGLGGQCGSTQCTETQICIAGSICVDIVGDAANCGSNGACPPGSLCILGQCIAGGFGNGGGNGGNGNNGGNGAGDDGGIGADGSDGSVCSPQCNGDELCIDSNCVPQVLPGACDPGCGDGDLCLGGECVTPSDDCDPACTGGDRCINGQCTPIVDPSACDPECTGNDVCLNGECVAPGPGPDVACDPACTGDDVCVGGECFTPTDDCSPACTGGRVCVNGNCVLPTPGPDTDTCDPECTGDDRCLQGECVTPTDDCEDICIAPNFCFEGQCVGPGPDVGPDDVCSPECILPEVCVNGECVPDTLPLPCAGACVLPDQCVAGQCVGPTDDCDEECVAPEICRNGECVEPDTDPDPNPLPCAGACVLPDQCVAGQCITPTDDCDDECDPITQVCFNGECVDTDPGPEPLPCDGACVLPDQCLDGQCVTPTDDCGDECDPDTQFCFEGECIDTDPGPDPGPDPDPTDSCGNACVDPEVCVAGECLTPTDDCDDECDPDTQICFEGECLDTDPGPDPPTDSCDNACVDPDVCVAGECVTPTDDCDDECVPPAFCFNGECFTTDPPVERTACDIDSDCSGGLICVETDLGVLDLPLSLCVLPFACTPNADGSCPGGLLCGGLPGQTGCFGLLGGNILDPALDGVGDLVGGVVGGIGGLLNGLTTNNLAGGLEDGLSSITGGVDNLVGGVTETLDDTVAGLTNGLTDTVAGVGNAVNSILGPLFRGGGGGDGEEGEGEGEQDQPCDADGSCNGNLVCIDTGVLGLDGNLCALPSPCTLGTEDGCEDGRLCGGLIQGAIGCVLAPGGGSGGETPEEGEEAEGEPCGTTGVTCTGDTVCLNLNLGTALGGLTACVDDRNTCDGLLSGGVLGGGDCEGGLVCAGILGGGVCVDLDLLGLGGEGGLGGVLNGVTEGVSDLVGGILGGGRN